MEKEQEVYFVIPIPPSNYDTIARKGIQHVLHQSTTANRHERVIVVGETDILTRENLGTNSSRVVFLKSGVASYVIQGETTALDGRHLAAAYAGKASSLNAIAEPMTNKPLVGFNISEQVKFSNLELEKLTKEGITVICKTPDRKLVRRSISTATSKLAAEEEPSIVRIGDYIAINIRRLLEDKYVGRPIRQDIVEEVNVSTNKFLQQQIANRLISEYANVNVKVDLQESRQVNVTFDCRPLYPLNHISISINAVTNI